MFQTLLRDACANRLSDRRAADTWALRGRDLERSSSCLVLSSKSLCNFPPPPPRKRRRSITRNRLLLEVLEDRLTPATWTVDALTDSPNGVGNGNTGDLRYCVNNAQNGDTINFDIVQQGGQTIQLNSPLTTSNNLTIDGTNTITTIVAAQGQAIFVFGQANTPSVNETVNNLIFKSGTSTAGGGAITDYGSLSMTGDQFIGNTATGSNGGAVYLVGQNTDTLSATNCQFNNNQATGAGADGGAIYVSSASATLNNCAFTNNSANYAGGAVRMNGSGGAGSLTVTNQCNFNTNSVTGNANQGDSGYGGAIDTNGSLTVTGGPVNGITFQNNTAPTNGGAITFYGSQNNNPSMTVSNTTFYNNKAGEGGAVEAALFNSSGSDGVTISGCLFNQNQATGNGNGSGNGGGLDEYSSIVQGNTTSVTFQVTNSTFYQNSAYNAGGGIALNNTNDGTGANTSTLTSLTVYQNTAINQGGGLWIAMPNNSPILPTVDNSIIAGNQNDSQVDQGNDVYGNPGIGSYDLIGQAGATDGTQGWANTCKTGTDASPLNPQLSSNGLQSNGGPTQTIALMNNSLGFQTGDPGQAGKTDQRGFTRPQLVSMGAYDPGAIAPSNVNLQSSSNGPVIQGANVTFTATATSLYTYPGVTLPTPTGTVSFYDGTTLLGTVTLNASGVASLTTSDLNAGTNTITAVYSGDTNFGGGTSTAIIITVFTVF
jgi:predicted outer membrane repeat protein